METRILEDEESAARAAAALIAAEARAAIAERGRFVLAVSGGRTPWIMLRMLAKEVLPWESVELAQVDERVAPRGHADRNLTHIQEALLAAPIRPQQIHAMPVEAADLEEAAKQYATVLRQIAGSPVGIDLAHLGLGPDGHTASLTPGDPVTQVDDADVAPTDVYQGRRRMTLTYPALNRARRILWLVTGREKVAMLDRLQRGDPSIPAGRVRRDCAIVVADRLAVPIQP